MPSTLLAAGLIVALWLFARVLSSLRSVKTTRLNGPPSPSRLWGFTHYLAQSRVKEFDIHAVYEEWAAQYGAVYRIPLAFGKERIVLTDPKALAHFYSSERAVYVKSELERRFIGKMFGHGVLAAEGESHKRQRKALTPAFSNAAIRRLTHVFFDSAHKLSSFWDATLEGSFDGSAMIEVQDWMNRVALDSMGIAGFSYDFGYLDGKSSPVTRAFEAMQTIPASFAAGVVMLLSQTFPILTSIPTKRTRLFMDLRDSMNVIANRLLETTRREKETGVTEEFSEKSIIGLLLKSELETSELRMSQEEIVAQNILLLAARYETTSSALTRALIELAKHPHIQDKLRKELSSFNAGDPTWDQLVSTSELPYLDAVTQEVLRLQPSLPQLQRVAACDDVIPLDAAVLSSAGEPITNITIAKGTTVFIPMRAINRSDALWGPQAKEFIPERWLEEITVPARELQGHRHLLTFHDGPRMCLGKAFALAEFKAGRILVDPLSGVLNMLQAVLSVLVRNYIFEFPDPDVKIETHIAIVPRAKVAGEIGARVPMRVRRVN
ncbi:Cytochrome P450 [Mycena chlorophos]|uniref:Cytochrome P450 n=1 Tax=Mycena chlorophos TaxID=658473 RepID=A0A8H6S4E5_MYCCL|nr:Cytochrome P450 [Mycena chlorophos]